MIGHVKLDGRWYNVKGGPPSITRSLANQLAAKVGGSGEYDDLEGWSAWVMDDWQVGCGQKDPEAGGWLYGTVNGLYPGQLLPSCRPYYGPRPDPGDYDLGMSSTAMAANLQSVTVGNGAATYEKVGARPVTALIPSTDPITGVSVLLPGKRARGCTATQATIELYDGSSSTLDGNTLISSQTVNLPDTNGYHWITIFVTYAPGAGYRPSVVIEVPSGTGGLIPCLVKASGGISLLQGGSWASGVCPIFEMFAFPGGVGPHSLAYYQGYVYGGHTNQSGVQNMIRSPDSTADIRWRQLTTTGGAAVDGKIVATTTEMRIPHGAADFYEVMTGAPGFESYADETEEASGFLFWQGRLYHWLDGIVKYTADEVTWESVEVCLDPEYIVNAVGHNQDIIVLTNQRIYRLAAGDAVVGIANFPQAGASQISDSGRHAVNFQGNVYFSSKESIIRYDGASLLPMGPDLEEGAREQGGQIVGLACDNNYLYCCTASGAVHAYNGQGWHIIGSAVGELFYSYVYGDIDALAWAPNEFNTYVEGTALLFNSMRAADVSNHRAVVTRYRIPEQAGSPYRWKLQDPTYEWRPDYFSYMETDWFAGSLREVDKDFESVYVDADGLATGAGWIEVFWQDDDSGGLWEYLGTVSEAGGQEIRWSDFSTRPASKRIKLRIHIYANERTALRINAIRTKFQPMVTDRFAWQVPVIVDGDGAQGIDGTLETYTLAQQRAHLDALLTRVPPFIFQDTDEVQYLVKAENCPRAIEQFEYINGTLKVRYLYNFFLTQSNAGTYTP